MYADQVIKNMYQEASTKEDSKERQRLANHALSTESWNKTMNMVRCAQHKYDIPISPEHLDRDPFLLEVNNGTVDLKKSVLVPHNPNNFNTKIALVNYDIDAECPEF